MRSSGQSRESTLRRTAHLDVALGSEVVDLGGLHLVDDLHEAGAVGEVAVVQLHVCRIETHREREGSSNIHSEHPKPRLVLGWQSVTVI